jgi:hypothetical protein
MGLMMFSPQPIYLLDLRTEYWYILDSRLPAPHSRGFVLKRKTNMCCYRESNPERSLPNSKYFCALDVRVEHTLPFPTYYFSSLLTGVFCRVPLVLLYPVMLLLPHPFPSTSQYLLPPHHSFMFIIRLI